MIKEIFNAEHVRKFTKGILRNYDGVNIALSPLVFADITPQITTTTSLLPLEPWQIVALKIGLAGYLTGRYGLTLASRLRENEGSTKLQKLIANKSLVAVGAAVATIDTVILTAPF